MNEKLIKYYTLRFETLINKVKRQGFQDIFKYYLNFSKFPASSKHHLAIESGLLIHSVNVYDRFKKRLIELKINFSEDSIIIVSLLHDICKLEQYEFTMNGFKYKKNAPFGHGTLSVSIIEKFMELDYKEREIIKYHMGLFGIYNKDRKSEYSAYEWYKDVNKNVLIQIFANCDLECSILEDYF